MRIAMELLCAAADANILEISRSLSRITMAAVMATISADCDDSWTLFFRPATLWHFLSIAHDTAGGISEADEAGSTDPGATLRARSWFTNAWALASERSSLRWDGPELAVCPVQLEHGATLSCRGLELSAASRHVQVRRGFLRSCMSALRYGFESKPAELGADCSSRTLVMLPHADLVGHLINGVQWFMMLKKVWGFSQLHAHSLERLEQREGVAVYKEAMLFWKGASGRLQRALSTDTRLHSSLRAQYRHSPDPVRALPGAMRVLGLFAGLASAAAVSPSVCGSHPETVPDCDKPDKGSCGNACCVAELALAMDPAKAYAQTLDVLKGLQDDGFSYVTGGDPNPGDDLRPYNVSKPKPFKFIFQGRHDAPKYKGPNADILDFAIYESGSGSVLRMYSLSRIHGALGDAGQNYKTLAFLSQKLTSNKPTPVHGCGLPAASSPASIQRGGFFDLAMQASSSVCGPSPSKVPDCDKPDMGSCGNACCLAELALAMDPAKAYAQTLDVLKGLQEDGYSYVTGGDPNPGDDLRPYNITEPKSFKFIFQGRHDAPKYKGPNADILDFAIYESGSGSVLRMFSLSRIHGALGDAGQNYKTLSFMAEKLDASKKPVPKYGCGLTNAHVEILL
ncbi:unnamed protein product [Symbiodinium sp. CCMP2456]|nr:unnamed protein product [Symbiodinium sp. CCMP2456]